MPKWNNEPRVRNEWRFCFSSKFFVYDPYAVLRRTVLLQETRVLLFAINARSGAVHTRRILLYCAARDQLLLLLLLRHPRRAASGIALQSALGLRSRACTLGVGAPFPPSSVGAKKIFRKRFFHVCPVFFFFASDLFLPLPHVSPAHRTPIPRRRRRSP